MESTYTDYDFANDFLIFLSRFKQSDTVDLVSVPDKTCVPSSGYYNYLSFKTMICEMIFRAINNFPHIIKEYTITCTNNKGQVIIKIGVSEHKDNEDELSVVTVITPNKTYYLNKVDVNTICIANRTNFYDHLTVHEFISIIYGGSDGYEPIVKTSWVSNKNNKKEF
jgi:hypothetical protein